MPRKYSKFLDNTFKKIGNNPELSKSFENPRQFNIIKQAILNSGKTSNKDVHELLALLVIKSLEQDETDNIFIITAEKCCEIVPGLLSKHLKFLGFFTLIDSVIPGKYTHSIGENELKDIIDLIENYTNRLALKSISLSTIDYSHLFFFCLTNSRIIGGITKRSFGLCGAHYPHSFKEAEIWKENEQLFNEINRYETTSIGKLIGYIVLEFLCNYQEKFYGFD